VQLICNQKTRFSCLLLSLATSTFSEPYTPIAQKCFSHVLPFFAVSTANRAQWRGQIVAIRCR
jgi:hypothetical protein